MPLAKPFRQNVALAIDGGGIKGVMVARALERLEAELGQPVHEIVRLTAGTSTGAIIAGGIARGLSAHRIHEMYVQFGAQVFPKSWRTLSPIKYLVRYQYSSDPLIRLLDENLGGMTVADLRRERPDFHMVVTATDIYASTTRFIKLYKERFNDWLLRDVIMASSIVPTVFPVYAHDYQRMQGDPPDEAWIPNPRYWVDGGVGAYSNPAFMAAYEVAFCLRDQGWSLDNTTLISIGTGHNPMEDAWKRRLKGIFGGTRTPRGLYGPEWVFPVVDTFVADAALQQVQLVRHFFAQAPAERAADVNAGLDFRRYNVQFDEAIEMDDASKIGKLTEYGDVLGQMIVEDNQEWTGDLACGGGEVFETRDPGAARQTAV
jgi:hypothetical protein